MKHYTTYVCENCGKESRDMQEIDACEAAHFGLSVNELHEYQLLNLKATRYVRFAQNTNSQRTRDQEEQAIRELLEFERKHGINKN